MFSLFQTNYAELHKGQKMAEVVIPQNLDEKGKKASEVLVPKRSEQLCVKEYESFHDWMLKNSVIVINVTVIIVTYFQNLVCILIFRGLVRST